MQASQQYQHPIGPESLSSVFGPKHPSLRGPSEYEQRALYKLIMGREVPEPLNYPEWTLKPKEWLTLVGLGNAKPAPKRQASLLSPLEVVAKARKDRDAANKAFTSAVRAAVVAGESAGKVGSAAGITRQRVYQIAS